MRQLLRRAFAAIVALSVVLSTLGLAYAPCDGRGAARGGAGTAHHDASHGDASAPAGCAHENPAPDGHRDAPAACPLVAHCAGMLPAMPQLVVHALARADTRLAPSDDARPLGPVLEIDSPPPRG